MMQRIQALPLWGRVVVFSMLVLIVIGFFGGLTTFVLISTARSTPRTEAIAIQSDEIVVEEFTTLPDDDSYPAALAMMPEGDLLVGSYMSGVVWQITPEGILTEIEGTRASIGSVTGIDVAGDGTIYILDRISPVLAAGAVLWRIDTDGNLESIATLPEQYSGITRLPDDIAVDAQGNLYISDRGTDEVLRIDADGAIETWWRSPEVTNANFYAPTGLAVDGNRNLLIITDSALSIIYEVPLDSDNSQSETRTRYTHIGQESPGWDGVTVSDNGDLFAAALGLNRVARLNAGDAETDEPDYLAGAFRGSSDVAYDMTRQLLYVANWDQRALLPVDVLFFQIEIDPHLPFAIDVIRFDASDPS